MNTSLPLILVLALASWACAGQESQMKDARRAETGKVTAHSDGLHGYIGFSATRPSARSEYSVGMGFYYSAVWPLIDQPLANFQIGLAGSWITLDNSDNKDKPLAPEGTLARKWRERGPTWESVFHVVPLHRSAALSAVQLERGEEGGFACLCGGDPRELAD